MKRLFSVRIELDWQEPVTADTLEEAEEVARDCLHEMINNISLEEYDISVDEIKDLKSLPGDFIRAYAYSSSRTEDFLCEDIMEAQEAFKKSEEERIKKEDLKRKNDEKQLKLSL